MADRKLTKQDFIDAGKMLNCEPAVIQAITAVESRGNGFDPEGFPITLFEGHWFHNLTGGKFSKTHPALSYKSWTRQFYGKTWSAEKARLQQAIELDREAALKSASWGLFQIMGFNHSKSGFATVQQFVTAMCAGEREQLIAFCRFIQSTGLTQALQKKDWKRFAASYNGPRYAENSYDTKLAAAYAKVVSNV